MKALARLDMPVTMVADSMFNMFHLLRRSWSYWLASNHNPDYCYLVRLCLEGDLINGMAC